MSRETCETNLPLRTLALGKFAKDLAGACRIILEHDDAWRSRPAQAESAAQRCLKLITLDANADSGVFQRVLNESGLDAVLRPIDFHELRIIIIHSRPHFFPPRSSLMLLF